MNTPYSVKKEIFDKGKKVSKTEWVRNADKKKDFVEKFGEAKFKEVAKKDPKRWGKLVEPYFPIRYRWLWFTFLDIWRTCSRDFNGNVVLTPRVLIDYCKCFKISLTVSERHLIFRIKSWAEETIYSLRDKDKE